MMHFVHSAFYAANALVLHTNDAVACAGLPCMSPSRPFFTPPLVSAWMTPAQAVHNFNFHLLQSSHFAAALCLQQYNAPSVG